MRPKNMTLFRNMQIEGLYITGQADRKVLCRTKYFFVEKNKISKPNIIRILRTENNGIRKRLNIIKKVYCRKNIILHGLVHIRIWGMMA